MRKVGSRAWYIPYIYGQTMYVVDGTPLIDASVVATELESDYLIAKLDDNGMVEELRAVSKAEYDAVRHRVHLAE